MRLPLITRARLAHGLHWAGQLPDVSLRTIKDGLFIIAVLLGLLAAYGTVEANDARAQSEAAAIEATEALVTILNGQSIQSTDGTWAAKCTEVVSVTN